jgi:hypothetical protein
MVTGFRYAAIWGEFAILKHAGSAEVYTTLGGELPQ